jgi:hypothetical protein
MKGRIVIGKVVPGLSSGSSNKGSSILRWWSLLEEGQGQLVCIFVWSGSIWARAQLVLEVGQAQGGFC